jgi:putative ABC transport system ATP-binding protein
MSAAAPILRPRANFTIQTHEPAPPGGMQPIVSELCNRIARTRQQSTSVILCRDIHKSYRMGERTVEALRGVDLHIEEPGFYAIMGQSGSGKSTLLHLLAALDRPDRGEIRLAASQPARGAGSESGAHAGRIGNEGSARSIAIHELDERAATIFRRRHIGIVFQQYNLISTLTARENVELPGMLGGEDDQWLRRRSAELMERLGISDRATHRPDALSGGEQQRIAIARALLYAPPVVLADEPTGNLDSVSAARLWSVLRELAEERDEKTNQGMCIVMVTHEPAAAVNCRRIYVLSDGRVTGHFDTEGLDAAGVASRYQRFVGSIGERGQSDGADERAA